MREVTSAICVWCAQSFDYVRVTKPKQLCSPYCANALNRHREDKALEAIRSGTLNPRPSLQTRRDVADCTGVLVPPSEIPANDIGYALEPLLPKQSWVFEVDGRFYDSLERAEAVAREYQPGVVSIYCRPKEAAQKAAS